MSTDVTTEEGDRCLVGARKVGFMKIYESKPSRIEAVQWTGKNFGELVAFAPVDYEDHDPGCYLLAGKRGAQDYVPVPVGHWIVRAEGDDTDYWPVDPQYFAAKYQEADAGKVEP